MIALTEGPLLDAHDYARRDYVESVFDASVDYANARQRLVAAFGRSAVDARRAGIAFAAEPGLWEREFR